MGDGVYGRTWGGGSQTKWCCCEARLGGPRVKSPVLGTRHPRDGLAPPRRDLLQSSQSKGLLRSPVLSCRRLSRRARHRPLLDPIQAKTGSAKILAAARC